MSAAVIKELTAFIDELIYSLVISERYLSHNDELSDCEYRTLRYLQSCESTSMRSVAKFLGVTLPRTSTVVDGLVQRGLVIRKHSTTDRRTVLVRLSTSGLDTLLDSASYYQQISQTLSSNLTDEEKAVLLKLSKRCSSSLKNKESVSPLTAI